MRLLRKTCKYVMINVWNKPKVKMMSIIITGYKRYKSIISGCKEEINIKLSII